MAKSKKEIILDLKKLNPNITPSEAAELSNSTLNYAKKILDAADEKLSGEIAEIGRSLGIPQNQIRDWYEYITYSISSPLAKKKFDDYYKYKQIKEKSNNG